jgi:hypothetical protein
MIALRTRVLLIGVIAPLWLAAASTFGAATRITATAPAGGAANVCPDTLLRIAFDDAPTLGATGAISIFKTR